MNILYCCSCRSDRAYWSKRRCDGKCCCWHYFFCRVLLRNTFFLETFFRSNRSQDCHRSPWLREYNAGENARSQGIHRVNRIKSKATRRMQRSAYPPHSTDCYLLLNDPLSTVASHSNFPRRKLSTGHLNQRSFTQNGTAKVLTTCCRTK